MSSTSGIGIDLSSTNDWRGLRPGMPRSEVVRILAGAGLKDFDDEHDPEWIVVPDWGMDLQFAEPGDQRLQQIAVDDPQALWRGNPLLGQPLHSALQTLGDAAREAGWRPENAVDSVMDDQDAAEPGPYIDEYLLDSGTLWLPARRIGLVMQHGFVYAVVWRDAKDVPMHTVGGVTEAQLEITRRNDLKKYLQFWRPERRMTLPQVIITGTFVLSLIFIAVYAVQENNAWRNSPKSTAKVVSIDADASGPRQKRYQVEFTDEDGTVRTAKLSHGEFFVPPSDLGEDVEVRYLLTEPIQVKGPAGVQEATFVKHFPTAIAATAIWGFLMWITGWFRREKAST